MPGRPTRAEAPAVRSGLRRDLEAILRAFDRAAEGTGVVGRDLLVGGLRVRLRAAGPALLEEFWPSLSHLGAEGAGDVSKVDVDRSPDLTIVLWDSASTGTELPSIPWMFESEQDPRTTRVARGDGLRMAYRASEHELVALDARENLAVLWVPDHKEISVHVRGAPFLVIWHWWMRARDAHPIHAGAVGEPDGGVLLVGRGGSGKSTTAVACLLEGMSYASDDYVMLKASPEPYASSLYCTAKLDPVQASRFPELQPALRGGSPPGEKVLAFMHAFRPDRVIGGFPVRAVLAPRVTDGPRTTARQIRAAEALAALAPSTLLGLPIPDASAFGVMADLVRRVPSFRLELGSDLSSIAPAVRGILAAI